MSQKPTPPRPTGRQFSCAKIESAVLDLLTQSAARLFARLQCRDYARFDFRTGGDGTIKLMEVNPNPAWDL